MNRYILIGQTPITEPDLLTWAQWFETADRVIKRTEVPGGMVSTVFLGVDHQFGSGPPMLFETMVFGDIYGDGYQERCSTWLEAEAQHERVVAKIKDL